MANSPERNARNREWMRKWRLAHPEEAKERNRAYRVNHRAKWQAAYRAAGAKYRAADPERYRQLCRAEYQRNILTKKRYTREHAKEAKERVKKWIRLNPDRYKAHRRNGKVRRRMRVAVLTVDCTDKICELQKATHCHWCHVRLTKKTREIDHVIPIAKGGLHAPNNLTSACSTCNRRKNAKMPDEWMKELNTLEEAA